MEETAVPTATPPTATPPPSGNWKIMMAETGITMFFLKWGLFLINCATLFLAVPWTAVIYYQAWANNASVDGRKLRFTGNAGTYFLVWIKTLFLSIITLGIYWIFIGKKNTARWVDSNLSWA